MSLLGTSFELNATPIAGSNSCRPATLARACFERFCRLVRASLRGRAALAVDLETYAGWLGERGRESFVGESPQIHFWTECSFPWGLPGDVVAHWFSLVYAQNPAVFGALAASKGWALAPRGPSLAAQLRVGPRDPVIWIGARPWQIWRDSGDEPEYALDLVATLRDVPRPELREDEREAVRAAWLAGWCECPLCPLARAEAGVRDELEPAVVLAAWRCLNEGPRAGALLRAAGEAALAWDDARWAATPGGPPALDGLRERLAECGSPAPGPAVLAALVMRAAMHAG